MYTFLNKRNLSEENSNLKQIVKKPITSKSSIYYVEQNISNLYKQMTSNSTIRDRLKQLAKNPPLNCNSNLIVVGLKPNYTPLEEKKLKEFANRIPSGIKVVITKISKSARNYDDNNNTSTWLTETSLNKPGREYSLLSLDTVLSDISDFYLLNYTNS